ncbi:MAG TPA: hypothetical protein VMX57_01400 [Planctomycetota bacterium]|nr:hypothetical protein [Planctomycetota bacterium]
MKARLLVLLMTGMMLGCNGQPTGGGPAPLDTSWATAGPTRPTEPPPTENPKPDPDAVKKEIERMDMRLRATDDVQPLPPELRRNGATSKTPTAGMPAERTVTPSNPRVSPPTPDLRDVIGALENKSDRTPAEDFQLEALRAVAASEDRTSLMTRLYGDVRKEYRGIWHVMLSAMDTCAQGKPDETLARLREAEGMLLPRTALRVGSAVFCSDPPTGGAAIEGIGIYHPRPTTGFTRGEKVLLYLEVADFELRRKGTDFQYNLSREASLLDMAGREAHKFKKEGDTFTVRSPVERTFWPMMFRVPNDVYAGEYVLRLTVTDEFKKQFAEERVRMTIR